MITGEVLPPEVIAHLQNEEVCFITNDNECRGASLHGIPAIESTNWLVTDICIVEFGELQYAVILQDVDNPSTRLAIPAPTMIARLMSTNDPNAHLIAHLITASIAEPLLELEHGE